MRQVMESMSEADLPRSLRSAWIFLAASMAVWEWNSAVSIPSKHIENCKVSR